MSETCSSSKMENGEQDVLQQDHDERSELRPPDEETASNEVEGLMPIHEKADSQKALLYSVDDTPPWYQCILFGLQHYLMMVESVISVPFLLAPLMCIQDTNPVRGQMASTIIFVSGLITFLQSTFGIRLPIVQGGSASFLSPTIAILTLMPCPITADVDALTPEEQEELWQSRMREIQGGICVAAIFQVLVGCTGMVGSILRFLTPLAMMPTITLIGLSLFSVAAEMAAKHWGISMLTMFLLLLFSQYLGEIDVPFCTYSKKEGFHMSRYKFFKLFPVLMAVCISWSFCAILTYADVLDENSPARTDSMGKIVGEAPWIYVPYPFQWGVPTVTLASVIGMLVAVFTSIIESVADYHACARLAGAPPPPNHALNRGIAVEGIGCILAGLWGTGNGTTSYSQNIGAIGITKVGSRRVIQYLAFMLMLCGLVGKLGGFFMAIPAPIVGGIFCLVFPMITAVGISTLHSVNLNSTRNLLVIGLPLFFGLMISMWFREEAHVSTVDTGSPLANQVLLVLLKTPMFIGSVLGILLDNTLAGTDEERGLTHVKNQHKKVDEDPSLIACDESCYDLPFGMSLIRRWKIMRWIPISPTFTRWRKKDNSTSSGDCEDKKIETIF
ncbi:solute carrier family 23 member 2-like isoform X1 [Oratosquilla oratoria]|uniref:solute carrier family 23 member 2-like isoform X1 n=1 Tax=Oratosquilla oratoria TaxID=337810 RepID=UPI003F7596D0